MQHSWGQAEVHNDLCNTSEAATIADLLERSQGIVELSRTFAFHVDRSNNKDFWGGGAHARQPQTPLICVCGWGAVGVHALLHTSPKNPLKPSEKSAVRLPQYWPLMAGRNLLDQRDLVDGTYSKSRSF